MITYFTRSASHLIPLCPLPRGNHTVTQFSDGELLVTIDEIDKKEVRVISSTIAPAENLLELLLLLDALTHAGVAKIHLLCLYFSYSRHTHTQPGHANGAQLICHMLKQFPLDTIQIIHAHHPPLLLQWLPCTNYVPIDFFTSIALNYDAIVAPDNGAAQLAQTIALQCNKEAIFLQKIRSHEQIAIHINSCNVAGKKLLIVDDIIATGTTISQAAKLLADRGAQKIDAAATHGLFSANARALLAASPIDQLYVTNTIAQTTQKNLHVYDISHLLRRFFVPSLSS